MFGSDILEVALGLVFVYLMASLIITAVREGLESVAKSRGWLLEQGLIELLAHDVKNPALPAQTAAFATEEARKLATQPMLERFYKHPLIFSLFKGDYHPPEKRDIGTAAEKATKKKLPSYIPSANFADALLSVAESYLRPETGGAPLSFDRLSAAAWAVPNAPVRHVLLQALNTAKGDIDEVRRFLQTWYDGTMDRISGWYRRRTQFIVFGMGALLCVALNINTVVIAHALHESSVLRTAVGQIAQQWIATQAGAPQTSAAAAPTPPEDGSATPPPAPAPTPPLTVTQKAIGVPYAQLQSLGLPIGWSAPVRLLMWNRLYPDGAGGNIDWLAGLELFIGWLMSAFAIMLGAPFWFDVLNNIMVIRSTVKPTEKSPDEPSKDPKKAPPADTTAAGGTGATPSPGVPANVPQPQLSDASAGAAEIAMLDPASRMREEDVA